MNQRRPDRGESPIGELLGPALRQLGVARGVREAQVRDVFAALIGPVLTPFAQAVALRRGVLTIAVSHPALSHQLSLDAPRLIGSLNDALGSRAVTRMHFVPLASHGSG